jgi:hypothetical protein
MHDDLQRLAAASLCASFSTRVHASHGPDFGLAMVKAHHSSPSSEGHADRARVEASLAKIVGFTVGPWLTALSVREGVKREQGRDKRRGKDLPGA